MKKNKKLWIIFLSILLILVFNTTVKATQVTYVSAGTGSGVTTNPTPSYPSGLAANDLILLQVTVRDLTNTPTTPTGFTLLYGADATTLGRQWIYYKITDGTDTGTITVTIGGANCKMSQMYAFRNTKLSEFNEGGGFGSGTVKAISAQAVTTMANEELAVSFVFVNDDNAVGSFTGETGGDWTEAVAEFTTTAGSDGCVQLQTATMATAGTITGGSYTMAAADPWGVRGFALIPAPPPADDTTFTVTLPTGYTYALFEPPTASAMNWEPEGQTAVQPFYNVTNSGNVNLNINLTLNSTITGITLKADTDNSPTGSKEINTTNCTLYTGLTPTNSINIWLWSDFALPAPQTTNKTLEINVLKTP